jgi:hypothetical protein
MKNKSYLILLIIYVLIGCYFAKDQFFHKAQHKANDYFEYWTRGNEFQKPELLKFGAILQVGKEDYLLGVLHCYDIKYNTSGISETEQIRYFDKSDNYKIVSIEQLLEDAKGACK